MTFLVYILHSVKNGRYYIGSTSNVENRLIQHNSGRVLSTRAYRPWTLKYTETFATRNEATKREFQLKSWKKRAALERLMNGPIV